MEAERGALERDGLVVVEEALGPQELGRLNAAVDRVWESRCPGGELLHELSFLGLDEAFPELLDHPVLLPLVSSVLGWNIYVYHCHLDVHPPVPPDTEFRWRWHQDGGRQNVDLQSPRPRLSLKVAYFLTDVEDAAQGALWFLRGSHRHDRLQRPADGAAHPPGAEPLLVRAGTAAVFDRRLWHARGDNTSSRTRKALFYAYTYRWIRLRDDLPPAAEWAEALDPLKRQLVGLGPSAVDFWIPAPESTPLRARAG